MKKGITFLLTALLLLTGMSLQAQIRTQVTDVLDHESIGVTGTTYTEWSGVTSNSAAVYAGQTAGGNQSIQLRSNSNTSGIITTVSGGTVSSITVTWNENTNNGRTLNVYGSHSAYTSPTELYDENAQGTLLGTIVNGTSTELEITDSYEYLGLRSASGAMYLQEIDITWDTEGDIPQQTVATPTFSPEGDTYYDTQSVSISCATQGASIYYTTDGSDPTESSMLYEDVLNISETTTIKAKAFKTDYIPSNIATATYIISDTPSIITIAEARALENGQFARVEGTVIFLDNRNVYIQDETAGIDLYLISNTVPENLAVGDNVRAYGSKAVFNGLVELSGINGSNPDEFSILSSGNELPLAIKTIAEINTDFYANNMLQSTRVKIENAIIGTINPNGTTVISQGDNTLNIYRIPDVEGLAEGDEVTITGVIGCYDDPQLRVATAEDIEFSPHPYITVTPSTLTDFTYVYENGGPSEIQSFEVGGENLTNNVIIVIPSENFEISRYSGESFQAEDIAIIDVPNPIYVRLKAGLELGTYNEQIIAACEDTDTLYVNVSGIVTEDNPTPPTPSDGNYVRINDLSQLVAGSQVIFAARFNENATDYYAMSNAVTGHPTGVLFTSTTFEGNEILPDSILNNEDNFYWTVNTTADGYTFTNAEGYLIGWEQSTNFSPDINTEWIIEFKTAGSYAMLPHYTGFTITNVSTIRGFALNSNYHFGPYAITNNNNSGYNFYLDIFVKTESTEPPTPTVATPTFTPEPATYPEPQMVSITCTTEDARIWYTTDDSTPIPMVSQEYTTEPIMVNETTTIKAIATKDGYNNSNMAEATYTIQTGGSVVTIFNQDWEDQEWHGWTKVNVEGETEWTIAEYSGNHYAYMNGYSQGAPHANEDWLISPAFNIDAYSNRVLTFRTATRFQGPVLEVYFSNNYDGVNPNSSQTIWVPLAGYTLSQGNYEWVESGPISLNSPEFSGTNCYIAFKYTSTDTAAAAWEIDDIMLVGQSSTSAPVVTVSPLNLNGFTYIEGNIPSDEQSFTVSGFNLSSNIIITRSDSFEISTASGDNFISQDIITIEPVNGNVEDTAIYVRLKAGLAIGNYNENITITCADVDDIFVACNGSVIAQPVPGDDYVRISNVGQLVAGNQVILAARYNETANAYCAINNTLTSGRLNTTEFTSQMNGDDEIIPASILADENNYYWTVGVTSDGYTLTNSNGDVISYNSGTTFNMNGENTNWTITTGISNEGTMVPNYYGFNIVNVTINNRFFALNTNHVCGAYHIQNMTSADYNFFLDIFMQGEGGMPTVLAPTFDPAGSTYYDTLEVTISCATPEAIIHYTLDGSTPNQNSPVYDNTPLVIGTTTTVKAYAVRDGYNDSPVATAEYIIENGLVIIFNQDWEEQDWHGWTEKCQMGDSLWHIGSYQGNYFANANGHNHDASIDWLISPAFDLDSYGDVVLTFRTAKGYEGDDLEVFFSNDYDGDLTQATWDTLTCPLSDGNFIWVESGDIDLSEFSGTNCHIGFKYKSINVAASWEVDDIMLVAGSATPTPTLMATPNIINGLDYLEGHGPSDSLSYTLTGSDLEGDSVLVYVTGGFQIRTEHEEFTDTLYIPFDNGELTETIYVRLMEGLEVGNYSDTIRHICGDASAAVIVSGTVLSEHEPMIEDYMPYYIQGNNGSNNNRVPVAIAAYIHNLEPNATYRYTNQFVDENDGPETAGAGNVIYTSPDGFYRSTSPNLSTEGGYGEFTTNEDGLAFAWFINEPTANARFTPGNHVYLRIRVNDGHDGTTVAQTFTSNDYSTVLNFGNENDEYSGTAFYAKSTETPMGFAMLWTSTENPRPIYSTSIETVGVDYGSINQYADFYKELVAGNDGWFGGILPNVNNTGINTIWIVGMDSDVIHVYNTEDGYWNPNANTINPTNGLEDPIFIDLTDDGIEEPAETNVKVWNTNHEFVIENSDDTRYTMSVANVLGQTVMSYEIAANSTQRIGHNLTAGIYIISLQNSKNNFAMKVIVQ